MEQGRAIDVTDASFADHVLQSETPVLVDFWAPWCGPCRMTSSVLEKMAAEYEGRLKVCKVNVDEERETATRYGIMSVPTLFVYKEGAVVEQVCGVTPSFESDLRRRIEPYLD